MEPRITIEPCKRGGQPCIRGLRITVSDVLGWLGAGMTEAQILIEHPDLQMEDFPAVDQFTNDAVFQLNWFDEVERSNHLIHVLTDKAKQYTTDGISELDTQAIFIEPILRGLGWDTLNIEHLGRESRRGDQLGDLQLFYCKRIAAVIETKSLNCELLEANVQQLEGDIYKRLMAAPRESINDSQRWNWKHRFQRGNGDVFVIGVLTNGRRWILYDFTANPDSPTPRRHITDIDLLHQDSQTINDNFATLKREMLLQTCRRWEAGR
jgi:uncharacterized protein (DUF433 family)